MLLVLRFGFSAQGMWDPGGSMVKNLPANAGVMDSIPGLRRSPGGGHGNPVQYSCLGNPMDRRRACRSAVPGVTGSQAQQLLNIYERTCLWDLRSLIRNRTCTPFTLGGEVLTTELPRESSSSPFYFLFNFIF